jgi:hypothetical protein
VLLPLCYQTFGTGQIVSGGREHRGDQPVPSMPAAVGLA